MFRLKESIHINAPIDRCFQLSTNIELVGKILGMHPTAGKVTGFVGADDTLMWRGWKFGLPAWHETLITRYEPPFFFQDTMGRGMFRHFQHDHNFQEIDGVTLLYDNVRFSMPLGAPGRAVGKRILVPHTMQLLQDRFELIKSLAEGEGWRQYLQPTP